MKSTYHTRVTPVSWSRLGRSNYGTNGYSFNFPTVFLQVLGVGFTTDLTKYYINPPFTLICAVIYIKIDSVKKFAKTIVATITARDFKSGCLLRMYSVVTNLATLLEFQAIRCATMLCHFGRTRNGYVATRFILFNRNEGNSATSGYVVAPERFRPKWAASW